jgi:putative two-component system response regulator
MGKTIFIVDDDAFSLLVAEHALEDYFEVTTFSSAAKMLTVLAKITPDLILLDVEMPEMTGFEVMKVLKANDLHAKIPVLFLSATDDPSERAHGIELGAKDFVTKPIDSVKLHEYVSKYI